MRVVWLGKIRKLVLSVVTAEGRIQEQLERRDYTLEKATALKKVIRNRRGWS